MALHERILECLQVPFKVPKHFKQFYQPDEDLYLNDLFKRKHGGLYFELANPDSDYADTLMRALKCARHSFHATLRKGWLVRTLSDQALATPNFKYMEAVESRVRELSRVKDDDPPSFRILIGTGNETVRNYFSRLGQDEGRDPGYKDRVHKFIDMHNSVNLFFINEDDFKKNVVRKRYFKSIPDFAVLDEQLVVMSNSLLDPDMVGQVSGKGHLDPDEVQPEGIVQSFLFDHDWGEKVYYQKLKEVVSNPKGFRDKGLLNKQDILKELD